MRFPTKYTHYGYGWLDKIKQGYHPGIDYNSGASYDDEGQDVVAIADGMVTYADFCKGWGHHVLIYHSKHKIYSHYAHLQSVCVKKSEQIKEGQLVGPLGSTGGDWPPHLHFEIRLTDRPANQYVTGMTKEEVEKHYTNPEEWIKEKSKQEETIQPDKPIINQQNNMMKLIRKSGSEKVYAIGKDNKSHWIFNRESFITGKEMGLWDDEIEDVQDNDFEEGHTIFLVKSQ